MTSSAHFTPDTLAFLGELNANNHREWFQANKTRYERLVREPALGLIEASAEPLRGISPHFIASSRRSAGSLMRVHRDTRFSQDKTPYKTNIGIQFRHEYGKDVHAPGFYVHIDPQGTFLGAGVWRPELGALARIRSAIDERREAWLAARDDPAFRAVFDLAGESLKRPPQGFAKDHPLLEDLKRKDFIAVSNLPPEDVVQAGFAGDVMERFAAARPFVAFLCRALEVPF